jgi:hypothetical protein
MQIVCSCAKKSNNHATSRHRRKNSDYAQVEALVAQARCEVSGANNNEKEYLMQAASDI